MNNIFDLINDLDLRQLMGYDIDKLKDYINTTKLSDTASYLKVRACETIITVRLAEELPFDQSWVIETGLDKLATDLAQLATMGYDVDVRDFLVNFTWEQ